MMTYKEYEDKVVENLKSCHLPQDYIDELLRRGCIRVDYEEGKIVTELLGSNQLSVDGYGYHMLYPDFPDSYEEYLTKKKGFDFNFCKI